MDGDARFVWRNEAKYKNLGTTTPAEQAILTSFGVAVGKALIASARPASAALPSSPEELRNAILQSARFVELPDILVSCWAMGIAVVQLAIFPLSAKRMHAMTVRVGDRFAILLGTRSSYPAQAAFIIAHELGHIIGGHLGGTSALLDVENPLTIADRDSEESQADKYALALLTGYRDFSVLPGLEKYNASQVAAAALRTAPEERVDPGILALCLGYSTGRWRQSVGALKIIYHGVEPGDVGAFINKMAEVQLELADNTDRSQYLRRILALKAVE
jgi:hypothetical protein